MTCVPDKELVDWGKLFAMFKIDKVLISRIHKKFLQESINLNRKKNKKKKSLEQDIYGKSSSKAFRKSSPAPWLPEKQKGQQQTILYLVDWQEPDSQMMTSPAGGK